MKTIYKVLPLLLLFFSFELSAQLDTKHWIPPFFAKVEDQSGTSNIRDHFVSLSTPAEDTIPVVIRDGFGQLIDTVFISKAMPQEYTFGPQGNATGNPATSVYPFNVIPRDSLNMPIRSQGLYFESFQPFFVNMRHKSGSQGFSLTSKGQVGLGTKFFSGHIYTIRNNSDIWNTDRRSHFISVMATEDNTQVTIDMIKDPINFIGQTPGEPITFTLDAFESYVVGVDHNNLSNEDINKVNGTRITSTKPIVTNSGSWLSGNSSGQCIGADQLVTADVTGQEYILVRGLGDETTERPMVVAIEDGTEVFLNDETDPIITLDEGEFYHIETEKFTADDNLYILATEKVFVFQTVSGSASNIGPTVGLNFIPPLNCVGAKEVNLPFVNSLAGGSGEGRINIITKAGTSIFVNDDITPLTGSMPVTGNTEWVTYAFDPPTDNVNIVSDSVMNVALLTRDGVVGSAGYFSGFTLEPVVGLSAGISGSTPCIPGNAVLQVFGFDTYQWYFEGEEIEGETSNTLVPEFAGQYSVEGIDIACGFRFPSNPFVIPYCPSTIGAAKEAQVVQETAPGSRIFDLTYRIFVENLAESESQNIQVIENIQGGLPVGATAELIGTPSLAFGILSGGLNSSFDGITDRRLLPGTGNLPGEAADAIDLTIRVDMNAAEQDGFFNQVTVTSIDEGVNDGVTGPFNGQDFSHEGSNPDPNGNGEPNEDGENDPTLTCFFPNTFEYAAESFCASDDVQAIELDGVSSGIFSTDIDGLAIDAETGDITPQDSDGGTYVVTFTVEGRCPTVTTTEVTIVPVPEPGTPIPFEACELSELVDLNDALEGEDAGGVWTDVDGTEVPNLFDPVTTGAFVFTYTVMSEPCSSESAEVTIDVINEPNPGVPAENTAFCFDQSQVLLDDLIVGADAGGVWTDENDDVLEGEFTFAESGDFTLTYTVNNDACGDRSTDVVVSVIAIPTSGVAVEDAAFCDGVEINLNELITDEDEDGQWFDADGAETDAIITVDESGSLVFTYTINRVPCSEVSTEVSIDVLDTPDSGEPAENTAFCIDQAQVALDELIVDADLGGVWTDSDGNVIVDNYVFVVPGDFTLTYTVTNVICGDRSTDVVVSIIEVPDAGMPVGADVFCEGDEVNLDELIVGADADGEWFDPDGTPSDSQIIADVVGNQIYTYTINRVPCAEASTQVTFDVSSSEGAGIPTEGENNLCPEDQPVDLSIYLEGAEEDGVWTDASGNEVSNIFSPSEEGEFEFTYSVSSLGCGDLSSTISISVSQSNCEVPLEFEIPQGFSPNGDGINDVFIIPGLNELYPKNSIQIFNRWGAEVLSAAPYNNDWAGKAETGLNAGEELPVGTYWYILELGDRTEPIMDFIYLNR